MSAVPRGRWVVDVCSSHVVCCLGDVEALPLLLPGMPGDEVGGVRGQGSGG